jgi:transposase
VKIIFIDYKLSITKGEDIEDGFEENEKDLRRYGHLKDRRLNLPQVVIGLVMMALPGPMPSTTNATCSAAVLELRASADGDPIGEKN